MLTCGRKRSKRAAVAVLAAALFHIQPALGASAQVCPPSSTPIKLNFKTATPATQYNHRLTLSGISGLVRSQGGAVGGGGRPVGLTVANTLYGLAGGTTIASRGDTMCAYLTSVDVNFGWERMDVYIPSEFPEGSCEYRAVLDHENQHVAIIKSALAEFAPRARAQVEAVLAQTKPLATRNPNRATETALAPVRAKLTALLREFNDIHSARSARIDTPTNYAAVTAMCKNWEGAGSLK